MLMLISLANAEMKWHNFILLTVLVLNITSCLARVCLFPFFMNLKKSLSPQREMQKWKIQASILRMLHSSISFLQRTFSGPRLHRMERVIWAQRYMSLRGCYYFTWRLPILVVDGGGGGRRGGELKKREGKGRGDTSFFMRDCHWHLEMQEGRISRKYYLRERITEHGEAGSWKLEAGGRGGGQILWEVVCGRIGACSLAPSNGN